MERAGSIQALALDVRAMDSNYCLGLLLEYRLVNNKSNTLSGDCRPQDSERTEYAWGEANFERFHTPSCGLTIRSSRVRFAVSVRFETPGQRAGLIQSLAVISAFNPLCDVLQAEYRIKQPVIVASRYHCCSLHVAVK